MKKQSTHSNDECDYSHDYYKEFYVYFSKIKPSKLCDTYDDFENMISQYKNTDTGKWYRWLKNQKPKRHIFDLIQLLLYGILHPQTNMELPEERNTRILKFYELLLTKYLMIESLTNYQTEIQRQFRFTWESNHQTTVKLSEVTISLLSTVLFLFNILLYSDGENGYWTSNEIDLINELRTATKKHSEKDLIYFTSFHSTQSPQIFFANPYITDDEKKHFKDKQLAYLCPAELPWDTKSFSSPVRTIIEAPPASGKTALYQAMGKALTRYTLLESNRATEDQLAYDLKIGNHIHWLVIAMNAQQYIWYWNNYGKDSCNDLVNMFFRGNMVHNKISSEIIDTIMSTYIYEYIENAHIESRLIFLFDGYDEICDPEMKYLFEISLKKFINSYPKAHCLLFSRPINRSDIAWTSRYFHQFNLPKITDKQINQFDCLTPEIKDWLYSYTYNRNFAVPFILSFLCDIRPISLSNAAYECVHQVITKEYDGCNRVMELPENITKQRLQEIMEHLAWQLCSNPNNNIINVLAELLELPVPDVNEHQMIHSNQDIILLIISQIGVLQYSDEKKDYIFVTSEVQAILAASYLIRLLKLHVDPATLRGLLYNLPDNVYYYIALTIIHLQTQSEPLFTEIILTDFICRNWTEEYKKIVIPIISAMMRAAYGQTPLQTTNISHSLIRICSALGIKE